MALATLFVRIAASGQREIWEVGLEGDRSPTPVLQGEFARGNADISPDGNWLAYSSDQSGQMEITCNRIRVPAPDGRFLMVKESATTSDAAAQIIPVQN